MNSKHTILLIDDDAGNFDVVQMILGQEYILQYMNSAINIRDRITELQPSAILLDIMMPVIDGMEALHIVKSDPRNSSLPVIMVTAKTDTATLARAFELGCNDYIQKPIKPDELRARLRNQVAMQQHLFGLRDTVQEANGNIMALRSGMSELRGASFQSHFFSQPLKEVADKLQHELNTPLNGVLGSLTVIKDSITGKDYGTAQEFLGYAHSSAQRMAATIRKLLLFIEFSINQNSSSSWPRSEYQTFKIDRRAIVFQIEEFTEHDSLEERLSFNFESIEFPADLRDMIFVLSELVDNAVKFGKKGGLVRISQDLTHPNIRILRIENESESFFPEEVLREIKPFSQPNRAYEEQQGMGLGLYLANEMVRRYSGELRLSNTVSGTRVDIVFPRYPISSFRHE